MFTRYPRWYPLVFRALLKANKKTTKTLIVQSDHAFVDNMRIKAIFIWYSYILEDPQLNEKMMRDCGAAQASLVGRLSCMH